jgi:hypothetical protein
MTTDPDSSGGVVVSSVGRRGLPMWVKAAIGLFIVLVVLWVVSLLALPGLQRAAISGNEASAIGYVAAVASAERLAAEFNKGYFLPVSCLTAPAECPPAVSPQPLLSATLTDSYSMFFRVASSPTPEEMAEKGAAARSIKAWTLVVMPRQPGVTGQRVFCTDTSGRLFFTPDANTLPDPGGGRCNGALPLQ